MKKTKKVIANILDRVAKVAATHAGEIAREVAISFLLEHEGQKKSAQPQKLNSAKKARPKRTVPIKKKQAPNN